MILPMLISTVFGLWVYNWIHIHKQTAWRRASYNVVTAFNCSPCLSHSAWQHTVKPISDEELELKAGEMLVEMEAN